MSSQNQENDFLDDDSNWVNDDNLFDNVTQNSHPARSPAKSSNTLVMVETAFLASTASLIWLIDYYFPLGPVLKLFFPLPIAFLCLRRGNRAAWMGMLVSGLLLSILMGPTGSILFIMPFGLMGVQLGIVWSRKGSWIVSIFIGTVLGAIGFFFRFWLFSLLLNRDLWNYITIQITEFLDWVFLSLGFLAHPNILVVQIFAFVMVILQNLIYVFTVHLVAVLSLDRFGNPIPRPPRWVEVLLDI